jgi:hypothetical protein
MTAVLMAAMAGSLLAGSVLMPFVTAELPVTRIPVGPISAPVIQPIGNGEVDWSYHLIRATGQSVIDATKPKSEAKALAIRGATVDAQRNLLETIKGVRIVSETRVSDLTTKSDYILAQLDGVIKGAAMVGEPRETKDGRIEVTMQVPIYGPAGIAPPVAKEIAKGKPATGPKAAEALPDDDKKAIEELSSVVFDLSQVKVEPQMFPTLLDQQGGTLLDLAQYSQMLGPGASKQFQYVKSLEDVLKDPQIRSNPTVIKIVESAQKGWVVAQEDIKKVRWLQNGLDLVIKLGKAILLFL